MLPRKLEWTAGPAEGSTVYLTFDDGPTGPLTEEILSILKQYKARATFFCVGENVKKNPELFRKIQIEGHATGNHTHHHLNGWKTPVKDYLADIKEAAGYIPSRLFRPPYGRIKRSQVRAVGLDYRIIMWTALSMDYDPKVSPEECLKISIAGLKPGSILVFHDNQKAAEKVRYALPRFLEYLQMKRIFH